MSDEPNGNGKKNGTSAWAAASVCSTVVFALGGAFGSSYIRDQDRMEHAIRELQAAQDDRAFTRGVTQQRLDQLTTMLRDLDTTLQREMRLLDDATTAQVNEMDRRLQGEMQAIFAEHRARLEEIDEWINETTRNRWTLSDQRRFEDQLGIEYGITRNKDQK